MYKGHDATKKTIYNLSQEFIRSNGIKANLMVDFGARHGESLEFLGEFCEGDYVLVEPAPRCIERVKESILKNLTARFRIHLFDFIVGKERGTVDLNTFEGDDDQSANVFTDRGGRYGPAQIVTVPVMPYEVFDERFPGRMIDFAKVNIEGGEYQMIEDGFFHRKVRSFVMELHNAHIEDRTWRNAMEALQDSFDLWTSGDLGYKYCFMSGIRCE